MSTHPRPMFTARPEPTRGRTAIVVLLATLLLLPLTTALASAPAEASCAGFSASYFNNMNLAGRVAAVRCEPAIRHDWGTDAPLDGVRADGFSVRWTGTIDVPSAAEYEFTATVEDGVRVSVGGEEVITAWRRGQVTTFTGSVRLDAGRQPLVAEYFTHKGSASIALHWEPVQGTSTPPRTDAPDPEPAPGPEPEPDPEPAPEPEPEPAPEPEPEPAPEPEPEPAPSSDRTSGGIWASAEEIAAVPTSSAAWKAVVADAGRLPADGSGADLSDQNSNHDQWVLAAAIVCARTDDSSTCSKARAGVVNAIGTEEGARWLAIGRNLAGYAIAADLLDLRADGNASSTGTRVETWLQSFLTRKLQDNNSTAMVPLVPFASGSNASAQEGFAYGAVAAYVGDRAAMDRTWDAFRTYACDPTAPDHEKIDLRRGVEYGWAHDQHRPCAVNPAGTTKVVPSGYPGAGQRVRIDGAIINDMRRGGYFQHPPGYTQYPWVGLEGFVPAAELLHRAGYPAYTVADRAVLRSMDYLWWLRGQTGETAWFDGKRADETIHLVNRAYGQAFPRVDAAVGAGRVIGYTDVTHPIG
jgi:hypothetical protein